MAKKVIGYREAMTLPKQPKKLIVVGSGAIGVEFAYFYNAMGTEVTQLNMPKIMPVEDDEISKQMERSFTKSGIKVMTSAEVTKVNTSGKSVKLPSKQKMVKKKYLLISFYQRWNQNKHRKYRSGRTGIATDRDKFWWTFSIKQISQDTMRLEMYIWPSTGTCCLCRRNIVC